MSKIYVDEIHPKTSGGLITVAGNTTDTVRPVFRVHRTAVQGIPNSSETVVQFNDVDYDVGGFFNTGTYQYKPTIAGYYQITANALIRDASPDYLIVKIRKNGSGVARSLGSEPRTANAHVPCNVSTVVYLNGSTDYVDVIVAHNNGAEKDLSSDNESTFINGFLITAG